MTHCSKPCKTCPFRKDVNPFLHPERAYDISLMAEYSYQNFPCHNTFKYTDEEDENGESIADLTGSRTCAGFLTLRANKGMYTPKGFEPSSDVCYSSATEMYEAYNEQYFGGRLKNAEK